MTNINNVPVAALKLIKGFEHLELKAYPDPLVGWKLPTIGYGTTVYPSGRPVKHGDSISEAGADQFLMYHLDKKCTPQLIKIPTWGKMNSNQQAALYSFAYNLGERFYGGKNFASITHVCDSPADWGDNDWVEAQFGKYTNRGLAGLVRRRKAESVLFCLPV